MNNKAKRVPFAGLIANGAFFFARFLLLLLCDGFCIMWIQCAAVTAKMLVIVHNMKGKKKMNIQWGTFNFTIEKIPLYNTEKNSSFVDVF